MVVDHMQDARLRIYTQTLKQMSLCDGRTDRSGIRSSAGFEHETSENVPPPPMARRTATIFRAY